MIPSKYVPDDVPKPLLVILILVCLVLGLSGMRHGGIEGVLHVLENWLVTLVIIPCFTALVAIPIKYRDDSFDIKLSYYMGVFVAVLFMIGKLRYWR